MTKQIWKYPLARNIEMPFGAEILCVQTQRNSGFDHPYLWAIVDPEQPCEIRKFEIYGTGHEFENIGIKKYIGTYQIHPYVYHVFEVE